jgi:hypothetical protein
MERAMARIVVLAEVRDKRGNSKRWRGLVEERAFYGTVVKLACQKEPHEAEFPGDSFQFFTMVKIFGEHEYSKAAAEMAWQEYQRKRLHRL